MSTFPSLVTILLGSDSDSIASVSVSLVAEIVVWFAEEIELKRF